jgi:hypothetical protein
MIKNEILQKLISYFYNSVRVDIRTKSLFFVITIVIWFSITLEKNYETTLTVPIKYSGLSKSKTFKIPQIKSATLKVRGKGRTLFSNRGELFFQVDLSNSTDSSRIYLNPENFINYSDRDIDFLGSVYPDYLDIILDSLKLKRVKISPNIKLSTDLGYIVSKTAELFPKEILLKGPGSILNSIDSISTFPTKFSNLITNIDTKLQLDLPDPRIVKSSGDIVSYKASIVRIGSYTFKHLIKINNKPKRKLLALDPISVEVTVTGPVDKLHKLSENSFNASIDYKMIDKKSQQVPIRIDTDTELNWNSDIEYVKVTTF